MPPKGRPKRKAAAPEGEGGDDSVDFQPNVDEDYEEAAEKGPEKKKRKSAPRSFPGLTKSQFDALKPAPYKKALNARIKTVASMVNRDWHDGYEEQGEELLEYFKDLTQPAQAIYDAAGVPNLPVAAYDNMNEIMKVIADSWENMQAIPARGGVDSLAEMGDEVKIDLTRYNGGQVRTYSDMSDLKQHVWQFMLQSAAANPSVKVPDDSLFRYIKDASDYGVNPLAKTNFSDKDSEDKDAEEGKTEPVAESGKARLEALVAQKTRWESLPTSKKVHRMRRAIDRRFDGPKHLRTRDFGSDDEDGGCTIM